MVKYLKQNKTKKNPNTSDDSFFFFNFKNLMSYVLLACMSLHYICAW